MENSNETGRLGPFGGLRVITSNALPIPPSDGATARRIVRHGMADVLAWLGEDIGPLPHEETHALIVGGDLHASVALVGKFAEVSR